MENTRRNYITGPPGNDDLLYRYPIETFVVCFNCNDVVRTEISCGWGISEHIPFKSADTSHICVTYCAVCINDRCRRTPRGTVYSPLLREDIAVSSQTFIESSGCMLAMRKCSNTPEVVCWDTNGGGRVAFVHIKIIEEYHFTTEQVLRVSHGAHTDRGVTDMSFFVISRYLSSRT